MIATIAVALFVASADGCSPSLFTPLSSEHMVNEASVPIHVSKVQGTIASAARGGWPEGTKVLFELIDPASPRARWSTATNAQGAFKLSKVPEGAYCFRASALGWQSQVGSLVVARKAKGSVRIVLELGV